jgi:hypothetical protein
LANFKLEKLFRACIKECFTNEQLSLKKSDDLDQFNKNTEKMKKIALFSIKLINNFIQSKKSICLARYLVTKENLDSVECALHDLFNRMRGDSRLVDLN